MPLRLTIEPRGLGKAGLAIRALERRVVDMRPFFKRGVEFMKLDTAKNFKLAQDPVTKLSWRGRVKIAGKPGGIGARRPLVATGTLQRSITKSRGVITKTSGSFGTNQRHAAIHQFGGTIVPRTAKRLAFPLTREAFRAGRARRWIAKRGGNDGRGKPGGWMFRGSQIWSVNARGRPGKAHWQMADSVTIPARPYVGFGTRAKKGLQVIAEAELLRTFDKAAK